MKYVSKKVIKGTPYYYVQYKSYLRFVGQNLPNGPDLLYFFKDIAHQEYKKLQTDIKERFKYGNLKRLEELHYDYICHNHELFINVKRHFETHFCILFTYHSNRQEGSKTTKEQLELFANSKVRKPKNKTEQEMFNSFAAFNYAISPKMKWNMKHIKRVHELLLQDLDPLIAGKWKNENNVAPGNQITTPYQEVNEKMKLLLEWLHTEFKNKKAYPPEIAIKFYCKFESIHPFLDGNGRVGRLLLNSILRKYQYPLVIFFSENINEHHSAITVALEGRWSKMYKHFINQMMKTDEAFKPKE